MRVQPREQGGAECIAGPYGIHQFDRRRVDIDPKVAVGAESSARAQGDHDQARAGMEQLLRR